MKKFLIGALLFVTLAGFAQNLSPLATYEDGYNFLKSISLDLSKVATVSNLILEKDTGIFMMTEGKLVLTKPVNGRVWSAVFIGKGKFEFEPFTEVEKDHLFRFYERKKISEKVESFFFLFSDSTLNELQAKLDFKPEEKVKNAESVLNDGIKTTGYRTRFLTTTKLGKVEVMRPVLEQNGSEFFYSHIQPEDFDELIFEIDPFEEEEIILKRKVSDGHYFETVNQLNHYYEYDNPRNLADESKYIINVENYEMNCKIEDDLDFSAATKLTINPLKDGYNWLYFSLHPKLEIDSIYWEDGSKVSYYKEEDDNELWIKTQKPISVGQKFNLKMYYHGKIIYRDDLDWFYILGSSSWYPVNREIASVNRSKFDITYKVSDRFKFVGVGEKKSEMAEKDYITTRWVLSEPAVHNSFNLGFFKEYELKDERIPPTTIYMSETGHSEIGMALSASGNLTGKNMEKQVGEDVSNAIIVFDKLFGKNKLAEVRITEIPFNHGQAFPGFIHLSWSTFQVLDNNGFNEFFRAHEVAHQWWGLGVGDKTYHDAWISEGFASFAGLIYMQTVLKDNDKFFKMLDDWKKAIMQNRNFLFSKGQQAGPIWLGWRTNSSETGGDYNLIIYKKGGWVLQMLRNMMLDSKTMSEDRFYNMMRDFYSTYYGKTASTEDFKEIVDKHTGTDMTWFFKQWVYGTEIPTYRFGYETNTTPEGKYKVTCTIKQENVSPDFQMIVPIKIKFKGDRFVRLRYMIKGLESKIDLPLLPEEPEEIIFNDLNSVLCEVKYE